MKHRFLRIDEDQWISFIFGKTKIPRTASPRVFFFSNTSYVP